jgi:hypothetical protein
MHFGITFDYKIINLASEKIITKEFMSLLIKVGTCFHIEIKIYNAYHKLYIIIKLVCIVCIYYSDMIRYLFFSYNVHGIVYYIFN